MKQSTSNIESTIGPFLNYALNQACSSMAHIQHGANTRHIYTSKGKCYLIELSIIDMIAVIDGT